MVSTGSFLDVSNWLNPAKLTLYHQTNSSTQWIQDFCGQRTTEPCEQICEQDTGELTLTSVSQVMSIDVVQSSFKADELGNVFYWQIEFQCLRVVVEL